MRWDRREDAENELVRATVAGEMGDLNADWLPLLLLRVYWPPNVVTLRLGGESAGEVNWVLKDEVLETLRPWTGGLPRGY